MYTPVFIYSNGCAIFASSVPSGVRSMKMMTFTLSVPVMCTSVYIFSNSCVAFASSVPSNNVFDSVVRGCVGGVVT
jgi:hypothetical protein